MRNKTLEFVVGLFILVGIIALVALAFKVSGLTHLGNNGEYALHAEFDNVGDLKVRAPVSVAGVTIGRVARIDVDPKTFRARVLLMIDNDMHDLPDDTSASIFTQGLLGSNYISLTPGFDQNVLKPGDTIETTHSALILENLIGQLLFSLKDDNKSEKPAQ